MCIRDRLNPATDLLSAMLSKLNSDNICAGLIKSAKDVYKRQDEGTLTSFFTTDSFEIDNNDIYVYARSCMW